MLSTAALKHTYTSPDAFSNASPDRYRTNILPDAMSVEQLFYLGPLLARAFHAFLISPAALYRSFSETRSSIL